MPALDREQHYDRRDLAEMRGFDPHPDDIAEPPAHLMPAPGVDPLTAFTAQVRALRIVGPLTRCSHQQCRTSLTEDTVTYCPHDLPFCEACVWEDACDECRDLAVGA